MIAVLLAGGLVAAPFDVEAWKSALLSSRERFTKRLLDSGNSAVATIARVDFGERTELVVGSGADADVKLDEPGVKPHHLRVTALADGFDVKALDDGATFDAKAAGLRELHTGPASIKVGRFSLRLSHQGFPAIIVYDPKSPRLAHAPRPDWFAPDVKYRVTARLEAAATPKEVVIQSTRGTPRRALQLGTFEFTLDGKPLSLQANRFLEPGVAENDVSIFFRDATTGGETYPVGRYVDPERQADGSWILDFNGAYNPACAWSEHFNCPIPPKANALAVPVRAGEKPPIGGH